MPKLRQQEMPDDLPIHQWHPIPKLPSLEYAHPQVKEYIESLVSTAEAIYRENNLLQKEVYRLKEQLKVYRARLLSDVPKNTAKNSKNSHQPPSWDHFKAVKRTQSQRAKSLLRRGGQRGHKGSTLKLVSNPDYLKKYPLEYCHDCDHS